MFSLFILLVLAIQIIAYEILLNIMIDLCFLALISKNLVVFGWDLQKIWSFASYKNPKTSKNVLIMDNWRVHAFPMYH
jgi:hypothetical protein